MITCNLWTIFWIDIIIFVIARACSYEGSKHNLDDIYKRLKWIDNSLDELVKAKRMPRKGSRCRTKPDHNLNAWDNLSKEQKNVAEKMGINSDDER